MTRFTRFTKVRTKRAGRVVGAMAAASCEAGLKLDGMGCKQKSASYARSTARIEEKVFGLRRPELLCVGPSKPNNLALSFLRRRCHRLFVLALLMNPAAPSIVWQASIIVQIF